MNLVQVRQFRIFVLAFIPIFCNAQNNVPGSVERRVEAEYPPELSKSYLVDHVTVQMTVDSNGVPYALNGESHDPVSSSPAPLPDNIVRALAKWKFHPEKKDGPFFVTLSVPVRRSIPQGLEDFYRRRWSPFDKESIAAIKAAKELDADGAAKLAERIHGNPGDVEAHATLLVYLASDRGPDWKAARLGNISWLVQNRPELDLLGSSYALMNAVGPLGDEAGYQQVRKLWLQQIERSPADRTLVNHATNFLRATDGPAAEEILIPLLTKTDYASAWLGEVYALAELGITSLNPATGLPVTAPEKTSNTGFAHKAQLMLSVAADAREVFSALGSLTTAAQALAAAGHLPQGYPELCQVLVARAKEIFPESLATCEPRPAAEPRPIGVPQRIRVGGSVAAANLIRKVRPEYPPEAKARRLQGTVRFLVIIGRDGQIQSLSFVSGPLVFYESAYDAVSKWIYKPTTLNGTPMEVVTQIDVNFQLN
jgi:TonB family protein